ncbi:MFS transporter [Bradyrhizobium sp.]|jgi:MFS family permease|uniref:MFS transporter n=1 Tax=Bradyrhizobium sp. TaxID=376 RepID=UPI003C1A9696
MDSALKEGQAAAAETATSAIEVSTMRRVMNRLVPFLMFCYFINFLDRTNIAAAALQMNGDLKLNPEMFGFGAGLFFLGYFIFEVPSNLLLYKFGARRWIARIMLTWGLCATGMAFIQGEHSFYMVRFLLGLAEAGFQPGIFFFLTLWFPAAYRGRVLGLFFAAIPISGVIGYPISAALLYLDGALGLRGWQWLYLIEGLPAIIMAPIVAFYLQDRVADAAQWLGRDQREWLTERLQTELQAREQKQKHTVRQALSDPWVLFLGAIYFSNVCLNNGVSFFLPQIVKSFGLTNVQASLLSAIPSACALICVIFWGRRSDHRGERYGHAALATFIGGAGLLASVFVTDPALRLMALAVAVSGTLSFAPVFWTIAPSFLSGAAAAGGLAAISALGILGGWLAPWFVGYTKVQTGEFTWGLGSIAVFGMLAAIALYGIGRRQGSAIELPRATEFVPASSASDRRNRS